MTAIFRCSTELPKQVWTPSNLQTALTKFHEDLRLQGYSASTIFAYDDGAARFVRYLVGSYTPDRTATHSEAQPA